MKHLFAITLCFALTLPIIAKKPSPARAENTKIVLGNLAQMIGHIGRIIENPHNADNVGDSVTNMVDNIVRITVNAVQKKSINRSDADDIMEQLYELCKDFDSVIAHSITRSRLKIIHD